MPAVSVLMPVYNSEAHIARAIDSIREQTWRDWEMIIVDDGCTDGTASVLEAAAAVDHRIQVIRNDENRGLAASLNLAFERASGEFIARMDGDDVSLEKRLETQVRFLREHPQIDVLGTAAWDLDSDGRRIGISSRRQTHDEIVSYMYRETPFIHPSVMLRRRFLETLGGYDESFRRAQDTDLWLRGYRRFRFHNLTEPLLEYRRPSGWPWLTCVNGVRAILSAGIRDRAPLRGAFFASRLLLACAVSSLRLLRR